MKSYSALVLDYKEATTLICNKLINDSDWSNLNQELADGTFTEKFKISSHPTELKNQFIELGVANWLANYHNFDFLFLENRGCLESVPFDKSDRCHNYVNNNTHIQTFTHTHTRTYARTHARRTDERTDGRTDGRMDEWMDDKRTDGRTDGRTNDRTDGRAYGGRMDGHTDGRTNGRPDF